MSISSTLASALSGLGASAKAAELVSSNIANATTPGYGRREILLTSRTVGTAGQGVLVVGVRRHVDMPLLNDRRLAQSTSGEADARTAFFKRLEAALGTPDQASSINGRIAAFEAALTSASAHPESEPRLAAVLSTAKALARQLGQASREVQSARAVANADIANDVTLLNSSLERIVTLNVQIRRAGGSGQDTSALQDQRQQLVDQVAAIVPLREIQQNDGTISLYTTGGAALVDGMAAVFGFTPTTTVNPYVSNGGGLSGLTLNGNAISTEGDRSVIRGGRLAANFAIRDDLAVTAQAQIDAVARDLVERFADPALDATRAPGDPGLFTDDGAAFDSADELGLSQRLTIHAAADPEQGGALWRLRDGLGAATPGPTGNSALISDLRQALTTLREPVSGGFMSGQRGLGTLASDLLSLAATQRLTADGDAAYARTRLDTFQAMEAANGVDTDQEMQSLLQIEQAYAANARVIQAVEAMLQSLMEI